MIYDVFENIDLYCQKGTALHRALCFARDFDSSQEDGRKEIDGDDIFAIAMSYETKAAADLVFESHKKYIDIQVLLAGKELFDVTLDTDLKVKTAYSGENDAALWEAPDLYTELPLVPGRFAVLYPQDIHRPCRIWDASMAVRKLVVKVRV